ncbi:MAG: glycerol dehydratase reactivase beta/small subunit family protein [Kouleothrix sp.]
MGWPIEDVLAALLTGVAREGLVARIVKVYHSSDCAAIGYAGAQLSGSGVMIGMQSRAALP